MKQKLKIVIGVSAFALLLCAAAIAYNAIGRQVKPDNEMLLANDGDTENSAANKQKAPDFGMVDRNGNNVTLSGIIAGGKPVIVNFWASWCPPCKVEMPDFNKVYLEIGDEINFVMVDLTDGRQETVQLGMKYVDDNNFSFPVYFDTRQEGAYAYGIRAIPTTLFIDREGYVAAGIQGAIDEETLRKGIELIQ